MQRLETNPDFIKIFKEKFFKDYLLTQGYNFSVYNEKSREIVAEHIAARSIVMRFIDDIKEDGRLAIENRNELLREAE